MRFQSSAAEEGDGSPGSRPPSFPTQDASSYRDASFDNGRPSIMDDLVYSDPSDLV